ncbi:WhiB family transcriptional regulator [Streptomyces californicus]|uniref:WhiB family transcriptional regulator n=1 Tax=Streptomyces californicus TaxID=67351 RepID=UPI0034006D2F
MKTLSIVKAVYSPAADLPVNTNWRVDAACRDEDPDLFFPTGTTGPALVQAEEAKAVCRRRCPVMETCLQWALESGQDHGVWGGTDEDDRRRIHRRAARRRLKQQQVVAA